MRFWVDGVPNRSIVFSSRSSQSSNRFPNRFWNTEFPMQNRRYGGTEEYGGTCTSSCSAAACCPKLLPTGRLLTGKARQQRSTGINYFNWHKKVIDIMLKIWYTICGRVRGKFVRRSEERRRQAARRARLSAAGVKLEIWELEKKSLRSS